VIVGSQLYWAISTAITLITLLIFIAVGVVRLIKLVLYLLGVLRNLYIFWEWQSENSIFEISYKVLYIICSTFTIKTFVEKPLLKQKILQNFFYLIITWWFYYVWLTCRHYVKKLANLKIKKISSKKTCI